MENEYGKIEIHLAELLTEHGMSKNKLSHKAEMSWAQIESYCNNSVTRLDVYVLCKLCTVLNLRIEDLLTFVPPRKPEEGE